jgi:putative membrane-bound dehydrogenase-like protein
VSTTFLLLLVLQGTAPLSPEDALKTFKVADGLEVTLVAAEPDVMDPVALAFDELGRLWVAEMADYPLGPPSGRIRILEDRDGDGRVDRSTVFARDIPYPTGVMPLRGGVLVTAAPDILFLKDADGDGKADVREVVFTGFTEGNQQHRVNGLRYGLDNWIHGTNGDSGGSIRPGRGPDAKPVSISGRDYRFRPDFSGFEPASGHGQFSNAFDDWGRRFINDNSNHVRHVVLPLAALARNPHLAVPAVEEGISDHGGSARIFPSSKLAERPNDYHAAGHFTSACSPTLFQGDLYVCEPVHNLVHRDVLVPGGASFVAKRKDENAEFLTSIDNWFRPVNLGWAPDGSLLVVDMYRLVIEHPKWIPLEMQKRYDLRAGSDRGRIWRVAPRGHRAAAAFPAATADLVAALAHDHAWWRLTAQRLLVDRRDPAAAPLLVELAKTSTSPLGRLHALRTLEGLGALPPELVPAALRDPHPGVREHAVMMAGDVDAVAALAADPDPRVRFRVALTTSSVEAQTSILQRDAADKWVRLAALSGLKDRAPAVLRRLPRPWLESAPPGSMELLRQLAELAAAGRDEAQVADWLRALADGAGPKPERWRLVALSSLGPGLRRGGFKLDRLLEASGTRETVDLWKSAMLEAATSAAADAADRTAAIALLALVPPEGLVAKLEGLLRPQEPQDVQVAAVRAISALSGEAGAVRLLEGWARYTVPVRREVVGACLSRHATAGHVVDGLEKGTIRAVDLDPGHRDALAKHPDRSIRDRAKVALQPKGSAELEELIATIYEKAMKLEPDRVRGEKVYRTTCATCHRLAGQGFAVGASLESVVGRDKRALLTDILDPNRAMAPQFQVYIVKTPTQDLVNGIIAAETPSSITLRRANAEETVILRRDILEIRAWPASLMPEGVEKNLTAQDFADLLEFLQKGQLAPK